ncbi:MAG: hypothetical protein JXB47_17095 [Anaerolineae bacterium]|nr:hypothetical protein [Anaerolineae bacterium]
MFNRLSKELDDQDDSGITIMDVTDMPPLPRRVMILLLRQNKALSLVDIVKVVQQEPSLLVDAPSKEAIAETIRELAKEGWLVTLGEDTGRITYRVNLGRSKGGNELAHGFWTLLEDKT